MLNKEAPFSQSATNVLLVARDETLKLGHYLLRPEHLFLGFYSDNPMRIYLENWGTTFEKSREVLASSGNTKKSEPRKKLGGLSASFKERTLGLAVRYCHKDSSRELKPFHLLMAVVVGEKDAGSTARSVLEAQGVTWEDMRKEISLMNGNDFDQIGEIAGKVNGILNDEKIDTAAKFVLRSIVSRSFRHHYYSQLRKLDVSETDSKNIAEYIIG